MNIKQRIKEAGMTVSEVAAKMPRPDGGRGITQASLSAIINGNPTINKLKDIAKILGISLAELVDDGESDCQSSIACPYCGKRIRLSITAERDEPKQVIPKSRKCEPLRLNLDDGTQYRYKNPRTPAERMAILELQTLPDEDGMCSVLNVAPIDSDSGEIYDEEFSRLIPL